MSALGPLLRLLGGLSARDRERLEREVLALLQARGVPPELAIQAARGRLPKIVFLFSLPPGVVAEIATTTWQWAGQLHRQAGIGVGQLQQGLRQPAAARAASPPRPAPPPPRPAPKPVRRRLSWGWFLALGFLLASGWLAGAVWSRHAALALIRDVPGRLERLRAETAREKDAAREVEARLMSVEAQAGASLTAQREAIESEAARLRATLGRWDSNAPLAAPADLVTGLPAGWQAAFAPAAGPKDALGNPVVRRAGRDTDAASGLPLEIVHQASGVVLVLVPAGEFQMGSPAGEAGRYEDEGPVHTVRFGQPFYLGKYQVTQGQWQKVMGNNPSQFKGGGRRPVDTVFWEDAQGLVGKLNQSLAGLTGVRFALPSEAQREYGCRAGSVGRYGFGDDESRLGEYAWYSANSGSSTHPVGQKKPNGWGLYDVHGNVWEWCEDVWHGSYAGAPQDGRAWTEGGDQNARVLRGGSWDNDSRFIRAAVRGLHQPGYRNYFIGVRVVLGVGARTP